MKSRTDGKKQKATVPLCVSQGLNLTIKIVLLEDNPVFANSWNTVDYKNNNPDLARFMQRS